MLTESNLRAACGLRRRQSFSALGMARAVPDCPADVSDEGVAIMGQYLFPKVPRRSYQEGCGLTDRYNSLCLFTSSSAEAF